MRFCLPFLMVAMVWLNAVTCLTYPALAQDSVDPSKKVTTPSAGYSPPVTERELKTYYLEREDGTLKAFFNIPFEEWDELYKFYKGLQEPDQPPRFLLRNLRITGDVRGDFAFLTVTAKAVVQSDGWVRIPLRMNQAMLVPDADENARGNSLLEYDQDSGLVWRVKGKLGQPHSLTAQICTKLRRLGAQTHLELTIPKATTSRLQLTVPGTEIDAVANENAFLLTSAVVGNNTRLNVDGIGGQLHLVWQKRETQLQATSIFGTNADVRFSFESQQRLLRADAIIHVNLSAGDMNSFIVQLPPNMHHVPLEQRGLDVKLLPKSDPRLKGAPADCEHVEFSLHYSRTDPIELRLASQRSLKASEIGQLVEVSGFRVFNAVSQTGTLSLAADSDWAFHWSHDAAIEQVENIPDTRLRQGIVASFIYTSQPYSFRLKVSRKEQRVYVEPHYELKIDPDRVLLSGVISYRLRGAVTQAVTIDLSGWQLENIAINNQSVFESELPETTEPIRVPLSKLDQSLIRDFDLTFSAELYLPQSGMFTAILPGLEANSQAPAQVVVRHAENTEIVPSVEQFKGLTEVDETLIAVPGSIASDSAVYRGWAKPDRLVYSALVRPRPPEVVVTSDGKITLDREWVNVRQDVTYRALYQPVSQLYLKLPTAIVQSERFRLTIDGEDTQWKEVSEVGYSIISVDLKAEGPGAFVLAVAYRLPVEQALESDDDQFAIPLAVPYFEGNGRLSESTLTLEDYEGRDIQTDDAWTTTASAVVDSIPTIQIRAAAPSSVETLQLRVAGRPLLSPQGSIVQVAWLQTWLADSQRSDRLAVRLTTRRDQVRFRLPRGAKLEDVAVDRRQVTQQVMDEAGDVIVKLPLEGSDDTKIVELWYSLPRNDDVLDFPQLIDVDWTRRFYWQLVLPRDEHLLLGAKELNSEASWNWQMPSFGRKPRFDQLALEQLVGTSEQLPLPESTNRYLFSSQGAVARVQITTASRAQVLLFAALVVFFVGVLLIYVPSLRHPASLLMLCVALIVIGLLFPHPTIQLAQLSTFGLLFVLLAFVIKWLLARTRTGPVVLHGTSLSSVDSYSTETMLARVEGPSHASTQVLIPQTSDSASK